MGRKTIISIFAMVALLLVVTVASANVTTIRAGEKAICENASWIAYNVSESQETVLEFDVGPYAFHWGKIHKRTIAPGGYQTNALAVKSTFTNKGPGAIQINCQRQRFDRHDWKIDSGSHKTYQRDYHLDHVVPETYIEPGYGQPLGTERGIGGVTGSFAEQYR